LILQRIKPLTRRQRLYSPMLLEYSRRRRDIHVLCRQCKRCVPSQWTCTVASWARDDAGAGTSGSEPHSACAARQILSGARRRRQSTSPGRLRAIVARGLENCEVLARYSHVLRIDAKRQTLDAWTLPGARLRIVTTATETRQTTRKSP
jgi:hypothetical protein